MAITVRECMYDEVAKFRRIEGEYHYMDESHGAVQRDLLRHPSKLMPIMTKGGLL